jgi:hypothetical protein
MIDLIFEDVLELLVLLFCIAIPWSGAGMSIEETIILSGDTRPLRCC